MIHNVNRRKQHLFLEMRETQEVSLCLVGLYGRVFCNDPRARTRGVEQDAVETTDDFGEGACIMRGDDGVFRAKTMDVAD